MKRGKLDNVRLKLKSLLCSRSDVQRGRNSKKARSKASIHVAQLYERPQFRFARQEQGLSDCLTVLVTHYRLPGRIVSPKNDTTLSRRKHADSFNFIAASRSSVGTVQTRTSFFPDGLRVVNEIVPVNDVLMPPYFEQYTVRRSSEQLRCISQSERPPGRVDYLVVAEKSSFSTVRLGCISLPVSPAAVSGGEYTCIPQRVTAFNFPWSWVCTLYSQLDKLSSADTEMQPLVISQSKHHRACSYQPSKLNDAFSEHSVSLIFLLLSFLQPGQVPMLKCLTVVLFQVDMTFNGGDPSQTPVPCAREPGQKARSVPPYLATDVEGVYPLFGTRVGLLIAFSFKTDRKLRESLFLP